MPLVVVPLFADQPPNARRVAEVGAGFVVEPLRDGPSMAVPSSVDPVLLGGEIRRALEEPALRQGAQDIAREISALPPLDGVLRSLAR